MPILPPPAAHGVGAPPAPDRAAESTGNPWTNPAAAAALRSTVDLLDGIEQGIVRNFADSNLVRQYATGLRSTMEIYEVAAMTITSDGSPENDAFLPLIESAGSSASLAETRLSAKELAATWPLERSDILAAIRRARALSQHVADQLDPRSVRPG